MERTGETGGVKWTARTHEMPSGPRVFVDYDSDERVGSVSFRPKDIPAIIAALTAATAGQTDATGPRWPKPEGAGEWLGRVGKGCGAECDVWSSGNGVWLVWNGEGDRRFYPDDGRRGLPDSPLFEAFRLLDAHRAKREAVASPAREVVGYRVRCLSAAKGAEYVTPDAAIEWDFASRVDPMPRDEAVRLLRTVRRWAARVEDYRLMRVTRKAGR